MGVTPSETFGQLVCSRSPNTWCASSMRYLRKMLDAVLFPKSWSLRAKL